MKVLMHCQFLPDSVDGATTSARALVRSLHKRGVRVTVCTTDLLWSAADYARPLPEEVLVFRSRPRHPLQPAPGMIAFFLRHLADYDLIHFREFFSLNTVLGAYLARSQRRPYLINPTGNAVPLWGERREVSRGTAKYLYCHLLARWALKGASRIICDSPMEEEVTRRFLKTDNLMWIPYGVNPEEYGRDLPRKLLERQWGISEEENIFLFLGRLSREKNLEFLLKAWDKAKSRGMTGTLVLAGGNKYNPAYPEYLRKVAAGLQHRDSVLLPGPVRGDLKRALLQHSVCLLLPSLRESFGNVVLEALAAGTPVLASIGTPWQCLEEAGLGRCLPWDREAWVAAMVAAAMKGFPPKKEFAPRSRAWVAQNYSWERSADRYLEVYREVTGQAIT